MSGYDYYYQKIPVSLAKLRKVFPLALKKTPRKEVSFTPPPLNKLVCFSIKIADSIVGLHPVKVYSAHVVTLVSYMALTDTTTQSSVFPAIP